jgi:hypothetical protein
VRVPGARRKQGRAVAHLRLVDAVEADPAGRRSVVSERRVATDDAVGGPQEVVEAPVVRVGDDAEVVALSRSDDVLPDSSLSPPLATRMP